MLLVFPPAAKPCEPPAGIAKLAGALQSRGISCHLLDANLEGMLHLAGLSQAASDTWTRRANPKWTRTDANEASQHATDTWTRRAVKNISTNIAALRNPKTYLSFSRYSRAVRDVNRALSVSGMHGARVSLADYQHESLSPLQSADLIFSADHPEQNFFFPYFSRRLPEIIDRTNTQLIGFSLAYLSQALTTFAMIGFVNKEFPAMKIVVGGGLVTSWMKGPGFRNPFGELVDHLVAGPGEGPLLDLLDVGEKSRHHAAPDYTALPVHDYLSPGLILPYSASSGCYWNKCSFCPETAEESPYDPVPVPQTVADLKALAANMKPAMIHFLDNAVSPALMQALAKDPVGVPWYGFARIEKDLCDPDYCLALRRAGCVMLKLGLESGDQGVLDRLYKGIDLGTASTVLKNLEKAGIATYVYLLFGTPAETAVEARKTLSFAAAHADAITFLNLAIFNMPLCGREAALHETGEFYEGDLSLYTGFRHPAGWDRKAVRRFLDAEFKRHPAVAAIMKNDPPIFTSNHAAFFAISQ